MLRANSPESAVVDPEGGAPVAGRLAADRQPAAVTAESNRCHWIGVVIMQPELAGIRVGRIDLPNFERACLPRDLQGLVAADGGQFVAGLVPGKGADWP